MFDFNTLFPWIGLCLAIVIAILMFGTKLMRNDLSVSKFKDGTWMAWLASLAYLIHNVEEYGIDFMGKTYAFPAAMEELMPAVSTIPPEFYTTLNVVMFWFAAPLTAYLSKKYKFMEISMVGVIFINFLGHFGQFFIIGYTPGLITTIVLFLPISVIILRNQSKKDYFSGKMVVATMIIGALTHIILVGSMFAFVAGILSAGLLIFFQVLNPVLYVVFSFFAERTTKSKS